MRTRSISKGAGLDPDTVAVQRRGSAVIVRRAVDKLEAGMDLNEVIRGSGMDRAWMLREMERELTVRRMTS